MADYYGNLAGTTNSKFRTVMWFRVDESRSTDTAAYVQWGVEIQVTQGNFSGTSVTRSWGGNVNIYDSGNYGWSGYMDCGLVSYGGYIDKSAESYYYGYSGTLYVSSCWARYWPPTPTWQPKNVSNVSATRNSDTKATVKWTNNTVAARPYSGIYVDRQVDDGSWSLLKDCSGSATSYVDQSTSANHKYRYRVIPHNGAGNAPSHVYSGYIYTTPAPPTSITITQPSKASTQVTIKITTANSASKVATKTYVQYRIKGGSWISISSGYTYADNITITHNPGNGIWQYRAQNYGNSLSSAWYSSAEIEVSSLEAPSSIEASNAIKEEEIDDTQIDIRLIANGASDEHPRTGFDVYIREVEPTITYNTSGVGTLTDMTVKSKYTQPVLTWEDSSTDPIDTEKSITSWGTFSNMSGRCRVFTAASYYTQSTTKSVSADIYSRRVYGRLIAPTIGGVDKDGNTISVTMLLPQNKYPYTVKLGFKAESATDYEWFDYTPSGNSYDEQDPDGEAFTLESEEYSKSNITLAIKSAPDTSGGLCVDMTTPGLYVSKENLMAIMKSPGEIDASRIIVRGAVGSAAYEKRIWFPIAEDDTGAEFATSYRVYVYKDGVCTYETEIEATNPDTGGYSTGLLNVASDNPIKIEVITVYTYPDGASYTSEPATINYVYEPTPLTAPTIVSVEKIDSGDNIYRILFSPSTGGRPLINEEYQQEGYTYVVYVDDETAVSQTPSIYTVICDAMKPESTLEYNAIDIPIVSSKTVGVRMVGRDKRDISQMSNSVSVRYTISDVNIFVYGSGSIKIEDCVLEGMNSALKIGGAASLSIRDSSLKLPSASGHYYDVEDGSKIFEANNRYE